MSRICFPDFAQLALSVLGPHSLEFTPNHVTLKDGRRFDLETLFGSLCSPQNSPEAVRAGLETLLLDNNANHSSGGRNASSFPGQLPSFGSDEVKPRSYKQEELLPVVRRNDFFDYCTSHSARAGEEYRVVFRDLHSSDDGNDDGNDDAKGQLGLGLAFRSRLADGVCTDTVATVKMISSVGLSTEEAFGVAVSNLKSRTDFHEAIEQKWIDNKSVSPLVAILKFPDRLNAERMLLPDFVDSLARHVLGCPVDRVLMVARQRTWAIVGRADNAESCLLLGDSSIVPVLGAESSAQVLSAQPYILQSLSGHRGLCLWSLYPKHVKGGDGSFPRCRVPGTMEEAEVVRKWLSQAERCANCNGVSGNKLMRCSRCKNIKYCSSDCQRAHWSKHKPNCN